MSNNPPSTQIIAKWVIDSATLTYCRLDVLCQKALEQNLKGWTPEDISDLVAKEVKGHLSNILRETHTEFTINGNAKTFEIDNEDPPYLIRCNSELVELQKSIQKMEPSEFEKLCVRIVKDLGGSSKPTGGIDDGGVDFYATEIKGYSNKLPIPNKAAILLIGQAKRYKKDNYATTTELRKFIGGAILKCDELRKNHSLGVLSPVVYAFWISSTFDKDARKYAESMGMWTMDGFTLAEYKKKLGISISADGKMINQVED